MIAVVVVALISLVTRTPPSKTTGLAPDSQSRGVLFRDTFEGPDGLITNHYAKWSRGAATVQSPDWEVESGSLLRRDGAAWTGVPTDDLPDLASSTGSGSQIFRAWTTRSYAGDVRVEMSLRNEGYVDGTVAWPAKSWDGVKIWLRRQAGSGAVALYTAEVNRRQGNVMVQKKCRDSDRYVILAQSPPNHPARVGLWEPVGAAVRTNADGSVTIAVVRAGVAVLTATDAGAGGCQPITTAGKVGVRGDNTQFSFDNFTVSALGR